MIEKSTLYTHVLDVSATSAALSSLKQCLGPYHGVQTLSLPVRDDLQQDLLHLFKDSNKFISDAIHSHGGGALKDALQTADRQQARRKSRRVLICCDDGISRGPAFAAAFLIHSQCLSAVDALASVSAVRSVSCVNIAFADQLKQYAHPALWEPCAAYDRLFKNGKGGTGVLKNGRVKLDDGYLMPGVAAEWTGTGVDGEGPEGGGGKVRFVCISDTHGFHGPDKIQIDLPPGDVLIHTGDFTIAGRPNQIKDFIDWYAGLAGYSGGKILIAGNHDLALDENYCGRRPFLALTVKDQKDIQEKSGTGGESVRDTLLAYMREAGITYLEDEAVMTQGGYKVYGSPWQPAFGDWAFNLPRGPACRSVWDCIPTDTDILLTHGPPLGHGDVVKKDTRVGCVDLLDVVTDRVKPLYHVFGHVHEGYGVTSNGTGTKFVNASTCTQRYRPSNPCIVFELPRRPSAGAETGASGAK
jgi:hypothetical protein